MSTLAIVGAGRGLGAAVARRFAREGFSVALLSRHQGRLDALAEELRADGVDAHGYEADVRDHRGLAKALERAAGQQGPIEVLQYSPLPQKEFLRPVLETTPDDLAAAVEFSVYGPAAAVHQVQQHMRVLGGGTILFVNGGTAVKARADFAGTSVSFAGQSALAETLHEALRPDGIHVGQLIIPGAIEEGHPKKDPEVLADLLWTIHQEKGAFRTFADDMD